MHYSIAITIPIVILFYWDAALSLSISDLNQWLFDFQHTAC